jgi:hypothetical protein
VVINYEGQEALFDYAFDRLGVTGAPQHTAAPPRTPPYAAACRCTRPLCARRSRAHAPAPAGAPVSPVAGGAIDHPLAVTEPPLNPGASRAAMAELVFETYGAPALHLLDPGAAAFSLHHSRGRRAGARGTGRGRARCSAQWRWPLAVTPRAGSSLSHLNPVAHIPPTAAWASAASRSSRATAPPRLCPSCAARPRGTPRCAPPRAARC